jgi:hypothetical protein
MSRHLDAVSLARHIDVGQNERIAINVDQLCRLITRLGLIDLKTCLGEDLGYKLPDKTIVLHNENSRFRHRHSPFRPTWPLNPAHMATQRGVACLSQTQFTDIYVKSSVKRLSFGLVASQGAASPELQLSA